MTTTSQAWISRPVKTDQMRDPATNPLNQPTTPPQGLQSLGHLGQKSEYSAEYDPSLLVGIPREVERSKLVSSKPIEFQGYDIWNCYEVSSLTQSGAPFSGIAKIKYSSDSPNIVESKSLKLYLNSFNMTKQRKTMSDSMASLEQTIARDLEAVIGDSITVTLFTSDTYCIDQPTDFLDGFMNLDTDGQCNALEITDYTVNKSLLQRLPEGKEMPSKFFTHNLFSRCKITNQPDHGTLCIAINQQNPGIDPVSLYKYIVSHRNNNHFHEEVIEQIFCDICDVFDPAELSVAGCYTRRGGIDINVFRHKGEPIIPNYADMKFPSPKFPRQ